MENSVKRSMGTVAEKNHQKHCPCFPHKIKNGAIKNWKSGNFLISNFSGSHGFTLVEALMALIVFSIGFAALGNFVANLPRLNSLAPKKAHASQLLSAQAEFLQGAPKFSDSLWLLQTPWGQWQIQQQVVDSLKLDSLAGVNRYSLQDRAYFSLRPREAHLMIHDHKNNLLGELYLAIPAQVY